jgi:putative colanic acid biosynthesis UDP-glucose lipid carrier transferase
MTVTLPSTSSAAETVARLNGWRGETETIDKIRKRVEYDLYYIDNWSVWLDLLIILRTFVILVYTRDAY